MKNAYYEKKSCLDSKIVLYTKISLCFHSVFHKLFDFPSCSPGMHPTVTGTPIAALSFSATGMLAQLLNLSMPLSSLFAEVEITGFMYQPMK